MKVNSYDIGFVGERIRQARKSRRYTQEQLSEMINMTSKNLSQLERGMTGISVSSLIAVCKALEVDSDYILFGVKNREQNNSINSLLAQLSEKQQIYAEQILTTFVKACKNIP